MSSQPVLGGTLAVGNVDPGTFEIVRIEGCAGTFLTIMIVFEYIIQLSIFIYPICELGYEYNKFDYVKMFECIFLMASAVIIFLCTFKFQRLNQYLCKYFGFLMDDMHRGITYMFIGILMFNNFGEWYQTMMSLTAFALWVIGIVHIAMHFVLNKKK